MGELGGMGLNKQELAPSGGATYDTRPMPEDGAKPVIVAVLADAGSKVELAVPVARLERIAEYLASPEGMATGSVAFSREEGRIVAEVELAATLVAALPALPEADASAHRKPLARGAAGK